MRKTIITSILIFCWMGHFTLAQKRALSPDSVVTTKHKTTIKGKSISYTAQCGTQPVWDEEGETIASLFYTYYTRDGISDRSTRPLLISFNGGPGFCFRLDAYRLHWSYDFKGR